MKKAQHGRRRLSPEQANLHPPSGCRAGRYPIALALLISICFGLSDGSAQEALQRISNYSIESIDSDGPPQKLVPPKQSLLNWSNPIFGTTEGGLFLWCDASGRPAVIMKTYKTRNGRWFEQVRSFSKDRLVARDGEGEVFWAPNQGAESMTPLPDAPQAGQNAARRLVQMKAQHRRFEVSGDIAGAGGQQALRPYPTPLYRYGREIESTDAPEKGKLVDGIVMGYVQGTGPDVLLLIEIRDVDGKLAWFYRFGSVGIFAVDVELDGKPVWSEPRRTAQETQPSDLYDGRRLKES